MPEKNSGEDKFAELLKVTPPPPKLNAGLTDETKQEYGQDVPFTEPVPARTRKPRARAAAKDVAKEETVGSPSAPVARRCGSGHELAADFMFCPQCGAPAAELGPPRCSHGHEVAPDHKFCPRCGEALRLEAGFSVVAVRPKPEAELSPEEIAERRRADETARRLGSSTPTAVQYCPDSPPPGVQSTVIHFLVDGFHVFGDVWYRGQEAEAWPGHPRWAEMEQLLQEDTAYQFRQYGRQMWGLGPWPGERSYTAGAGQFEQLKTVGGEGVVSQPTVEELARADEAERRRGRRLPAPLAL